MLTLLTFANWLLPLAYLALVIDYGATFILRVRTHVRNPALALVIVFHAAFLTGRAVHGGTLPLSGIHEVLCLVALSSAILYAGTERISRDRRAGVFVLLLVFLMQYTASTAMAGTIAAPTGPKHGAQPLERLHFIPAVFAYTAIAFAAVYALLYLVGQRNLKRHRFGLLFDRLPPLELLAAMSWHALLGGFVLMTVTIATGAILFARMGQAAHGGSFDLKVAAKIVTGSIAWIACLAGVLGKYLARWSARRLCQITVAGFVVILILFAASMILSS
jgi:ABC-type uncharacterized transport system permease subunit